MFILLIILFIIILFFRSPIRYNYEYDKKYVYSPTDGTIKDIYIKDNKLRIVYFLSIFDNHTQYFPLNSKIIKVTDYLGKHKKAYKEESVKNSNKDTILQSLDYKFYYNIIQRTGYLTRRIIHFAKKNILYNTGEKLGFIMFGSRVDIDIPIEYVKNILIKKNQIIRGITPIIELNVDYLLT